MKYYRYYLENWILLFQNRTYYNMMSEKDVSTLSGNKRLNQTEVSMNINNSINNTNIIPLHSHYIFKKTNPSIKTNQTEEKFNIPFRLLDEDSKISTVKQNNNHYNSSKVPIFGKIGFGSSEERKSQIFQGLKIAQLPQKQNLISIIYNNNKHRIKNSQMEKQSEVYRSTKNLKKLKELKVGFGSSENLQRNQNKKYKKSCPGPGHYEIGQRIDRDGEKKIKQIDPLKNRKQQLKKQSEIGPGSYFNEKQKKDIGQKQKRRQFFVDKKAKVRNLLQKINFEYRLKKINYQNQKLANIHNKIHRDFQNSHNNSHNNPHDNPHYNSHYNSLLRKTKNRSVDKFLGKSQKKNLIRNQLRDRTNQFLLKVEDATVEFQEPYLRPPNYKYMFSNSFVSKNDHAFQAHFYRPKQKQSQFIYVEAKKEEKRFESQSSFFKSKSIRLFF